MSAPKKQKTSGLGVEVSCDEIHDVLANLMQHVKFLQNNAPTQIPKEDLAADEIIEYLKPVTAPAGPLVVKRCCYEAGRSNLMVTYPAAEQTDKVVSFVGCHMDVVAACAEDWDKNPFELIREGDKIFGRGVTDCLGHVAVVTIIMKHLADLQLKLNANIVAVFIANEEGTAGPGVGIDGMMAHKELDHLVGGPLFWVDSANFGPTLATAGMLTWELKAKGKRFHSGIPQNGVNPIGLATRAIDYCQKRFYEDFPQTAKEHDYKFAIGSTFKPTQIKTPPGSINQIPGICIVAGDVRITPFYSADEIKTKISGYITDFNAGIAGVAAPQYESYVLDDCKGSVELKFTCDEPMVGVACDLNSPGYKAVFSAVEAVRGTCEPFSLTGSLPLIAELQANGFDVQITGFGRMEAYHAVNEFALLSELQQGSRIICKIIEQLAM